MPRIIAATLLALYSFVIARLTLAPASVGSSAFALADRLATAVSDGRLDWTRTEVLANIALFVPAGFLLAIVLRRPWLAVLVCVLVSAGIETAQLLYLPSRVPTVADVQHNGLGALIGALLAWPFTAQSGRAPKSRSAVETVPAVRPGAW